MTPSETVQHRTEVLPMRAQSVIKRRRTAIDPVLTEPDQATTRRTAAREAIRRE